MGEHCVCGDCGCKHLVWEKSCPYCRRTAELAALRKAAMEYLRTGGLGDREALRRAALQGEGDAQRT